MRASAGSHRTFLYIRVSTHDQADRGTSLEGQRERGLKFCAQEGYADPQVRVEVESAGEDKIERRQELRRILSEIGSSDRLVCLDLDRWSRDQVFAVHSVRQLRARGVTVRFHAQPFLDEVRGAPVDLLGIIAWAAETERKMIRERTIGNRRRLRANGAFVEGLPPFGYAVQDRRLVVVREHALIVVRMYADSANGVSVRKISEWLRVEYPSVVVGKTKPRLMRWTVNTVIKILRNRLYTGCMETSASGRKRRGDPGSGEWMETHEAIIPPALFDQVAQGLVARARSGQSVARSLTADWLLKRVVKCAECGYTMRATADRRVKGGDGGYYVCAKRCDPTKYKDRAPCTNKVAAPWREADDATEAMTLTHLDGLARELSAGRPPTRAEQAPDFKRLAAELADARTNAVRLVVKGIISEKDAAKQLTELKRDEEALEARRAEYERRQTNDTEDARRAAFAKLTEYRGVWARLTAADRRELLSELAEAVTLTASGDVVIKWRPVAAVAVAIGSSGAEGSSLPDLFGSAA